MTIKPKRCAICTRPAINESNFCSEECAQIYIVQYQNALVLDALAAKIFESIKLN